MLAKFKRMSRMARVAIALVAVVSAWVVSAMLASQPLWQRMIVSLITALVVGLLAVLLFGARRNQ